MYIHNPYFPIIPFEFQNLVNVDLPNEFLNISCCNIIEMVDLLVGICHNYGGGVLHLSVSTPCSLFTDIMSAINHPYTHTFLMALSRGQFLCAIFNRETIYLTHMIY